MCDIMSWLRRSSNNKTDKISKLETAIARLAEQISQLKSVAQSTHRQVGEIKQTLEEDHLDHAVCENTQDQRWESHGREHQRYDADLEKLRQLVEKNAEAIDVLSRNVSRLFDEQRFNRQGGK